MAAALDIIRKRRSVFPNMYNDTPVTKESIQVILNSANCAPTHKLTEPWRFKVIMGKKKTELGVFLSEKYKSTVDKPSDLKINKLVKNPQKAAAIILINMQRDPKESLPEWEELAATAMAVQNMWLTCTELGIGSYWSSPGLIKYMPEFVDMKKGERCLGLFYMGYTDMDIPAPNRGSIEDKVEWFD